MSRISRAIHASYEKGDYTFSSGMNGSGMTHICHQGIIPLCLHRI